MAEPVRQVHTHVHKVPSKSGIPAGVALVVHTVEDQAGTQPTGTKMVMWADTARLIADQLKTAADQADAENEAMVSFALTELPELHETKETDDDG
jgi:hypothetical protein